MIPVKTIKLNGQDVSMIYCPATENGFEDISPKSINVFFPTFGKDKDGNDIITEPAKATIGDFVTLAMSAIVAYYAREKQEPPINSEYILYEATPQERTDLLTAITEIRGKWYAVPQTVADTLKEDAAKQTADEQPKND